MAKKKRNGSRRSKTVGLIPIYETFGVLNKGDLSVALNFIESGDFAGAMAALGNAAPQVTPAALKAGFKIKIIRSAVGRLPLLKFGNIGISAV